jgi:Uma2 family endonuclease
MASEHRLVAASDGVDWIPPEPSMPRATYEDVLNAPENKVAEILDGELVLSPRPASPHATASSRLGVELGGPFDRGRGGPGGWWILDEPELHFGEDVLVPDLSGWRRERMPAVPVVAFFTLPPDWVCEVLSPSTERIDRAKKLRLYAAAGVAHAWLVDPIERTLEVLRLRDGAWTIVCVFAGSELVRAEPFAEVELALGDLWLDAAPATDTR